MQRARSCFVTELATVLEVDQQKIQADLDALFAKLAGEEVGREDEEDDDESADRFDSSVNAIGWRGDPLPRRSVINGHATKEVAASVPRWKPPVKPSPREKLILKRCQKKRRLFASLRERRQEVFSDDMQAELESVYRNTGAGKEPVAPALMAMALILQGYLKLSDADAVEMTVVDLRWQMVLDCIGAEKPAFSQGGWPPLRSRSRPK